MKRRDIREGKIEKMRIPKITGNGLKILSYSDS